MVTRIWEGKKELVEKSYYCGQVRIEEGRLKGCYRTVTEEYSKYKEAEKALWYWSSDKGGIENDCIYRM